MFSFLNLKNLRRREFLSMLLTWIGGIFFFAAISRKSANSGERIGERNKKRSRVVIVSHPRAADGTPGKDNDNLNDNAVKQMVDEGIKAFTGKNDLTEAWAEIIPDPNKKIGIKVNCQIKGIYTKAKVVKPITDGLILRGVNPDNIIIYDKTDHAFGYAGFTKNLGEGIKVGRVADFGGYHRFLFNRIAKLLNGGFSDPVLNIVDYIRNNASSKALNYIVSRLISSKGKFNCEYIINVPVLKAIDGYAGVSLSMKNHYGSIGNPYDHHKDFTNFLPYLNNLPQIRNKTRLIVMDAVFGEYKWQNGREQDFVDVFNKIIISDDTVAIDYTGWQMIEKKRKEKLLPPVTPQPAYIQRANDLNLGNSDPEQIDNVYLNI